jgi:hypothetical protein
LVLTSGLSVGKISPNLGRVEGPQLAYSGRPWQAGRRSHLLNALDANAKHAGYFRHANARSEGGGGNIGLRHTSVGSFRVMARPADRSGQLVRIYAAMPHL